VTAGIPGTGIGGLYYVFLALWLPFRELGLTLRGRSDRARWRTIALRSSVAWGILAALWGEAWLLKRSLIWIAWHTPSGTWWHRMTIGASPSLIAVAATWVGMAILGGVVLTTHILRLWVWRGRVQGERRSFQPPPSRARGSFGRRDTVFPPPVVGVAGFEWRPAPAQDQVPSERTR